MNFGEALEVLKSGKKLAMGGWNGKGLWIELQFPDQHSKMTRPYIFMSCPRGSTNHFGEQKNEIERVPWLPSVTDLLADNWNIVE
jgi:hypothetical protein